MDLPIRHRGIRSRIGFQHRVVRIYDQSGLIGDTEPFRQAGAGLLVDYLSLKCFPRVCQADGEAESAEPAPTFASCRPCLHKPARSTDAPYDRIRHSALV